VTVGVVFVPIEEDEDMVIWYSVWDRPQKDGDRTWGYDVNMVVCRQK